MLPTPAAASYEQRGASLYSKGTNSISIYDSSGAEVYSAELKSEDALAQFRAPWWGDPIVHDAGSFTLPAGNYEIVLSFSAVAKKPASRLDGQGGYNPANGLRFHS